MKESLKILQAVTRDKTLGKIVRNRTSFNTVWEKLKILLITKSCCYKINTH